MKKSNASTVFSVIEALIAIAALAFFIMLIVPGIGMGYIISSLSGQYGQTIYVVCIIAALAVMIGSIILILATRELIIRKHKQTANKQ